MSANSAKSSNALDRPFDPKLLKRARDLAARYQIVLHVDDGHYFGASLELPLVMNERKTADGRIKNTRASLTSAIAHRLEQHQTPPVPKSPTSGSPPKNSRSADGPAKPSTHGSPKSPP